MQGQGRQLVQRALIQLRGVDHIAAGDAVPHGAGEVAACGVVGLDPGGDGPDAIGQAGQGAEQGGQAVIGALGHLRGLFQQLFAGGGVELRVGAQEGQESGEVAGPAGGAHLALHPGADAGDFVQADLVDLFRGQVGGGVATHQPGVDVAAARAVAQAGCLGRDRQIVVLEEVPPAATARVDVVADNGFGPGLICAALTLGEGGRKVGGGAKERIGGGGQGDIGFGQQQGAFDHGARLEEAGVEAPAGIGEGGVEQGAHVFQPGQPGLDIVAVGQAHGAGDIGRRLAEAALGVEGHARDVEVDALDGAGDQPGGKGVVLGLVRAEGCDVNGGQPVGQGDQLRATCQFTRAREVGQAGFRGLVALLGGAEGVVAFEEGLIVVEDGGQGLAGAGGRGGRRRRGAGGRCRAGRDADHERRKRRGQNRSVHWSFPLKSNGSRDEGDRPVKRRLSRSGRRSALCRRWRQDEPPSGRGLRHREAPASQACETAGTPAVW